MALIFLFPLCIFALNFCYGLSEELHREDKHAHWIPAKHPLWIPAKKAPWIPASESRQLYQVTLSMKEPMQYISSPGYPYKYYPPDIQLMYEIKIELDDEVTQLSTRILMTFEMFALEESEFCHKDGLEIAGPSNQVRVFELDDEVTQLSTRILMTFEMFALEESEFCHKDGLEIAGPSNQVRVYCGVNVGQTVLSEGNQVSVRFFTDSEVQSRGYSIRLEMYNSGCSSLFSGASSGSFSSPNFPNRYRSHDLCVWKIEAPEDKTIRVKFDDVFDIRAYEPLCSQDYLQVSISGDFSKDVKRLCHDTQRETIDSVGNVVLFLFRTDCCFEGKGFKATFAVIEPDIVTPPPPPPDACPCGEENEAERIVGGQTVDPPNRYPWMVGLAYNNGEIFCGAALVNTQYVMTACHCLERESINTVRAVLGSHSSTNYPEPVALSEIVMYPTYRNRTYTNDIALVKLKDPVTFSREVKPICLPDENFNADDVQAVIAGWGYVQDGGKGSDMLKEVEVTVNTHAQCVGKYGGVILETNICAGGEEGQDSCQGDSGGALFTKRGGRWYAVGISSWGIGCGRKGYPGVYTRVSEFRKWLDVQIDDAPPCDTISPPIQPNFEDCGIPNKKDMERVVGGKEAVPFKYTWMCMIVYDQVVEGAGALISPHYVLTAASVFDTWQTWYPEILDVFLGKHDLSVKESYTRRFGVKSVTIHKGYGSPSPYNNDLALLKLDVPDEGAPPQFRPICLPRSTDSYKEGLALTTAGWGRTSTSKMIFTPNEWLIFYDDASLACNEHLKLERNNDVYLLAWNDGPGSTVLMEVDLDVVSQDSCSNTYPGWVTNKMICAYREGKDTCKGDSGAPLMKFYNGRYYLIGVSSWAMKDSCAAPGKPRVFSAVHRNLAWIASYTEIPIS